MVETCTSLPRPPLAWPAGWVPGARTRLLQGPRAQFTEQPAGVQAITPHLPGRESREEERQTSREMEDSEDAAGREKKAAP